MNRINFYTGVLEKLPQFLTILVIRAVNWFFQGILFEERSEQIFKILTDLILTLVFAVLLINFIPLKVSIIIAFIIAHSFNWIFNTNIHSARAKKSGRIQNNSKRFMSCLNYLQMMIPKQKSIYGAAIFGSMSTGKFHRGSDIDVKLFRKHGFMNSVKSCLFLSSLRTKANFHKFPLDIYVVDNINSYIPKKDEVPVILHDPERILEKQYSRVTYFSYFKNE